MDFGLHLPASSANVKPEDLVRFAQQAEALGFYCLTVADHVVVPKDISIPYPYTVDGKYPGTGYHLETLTTMSFLAGATRHIRFATSVMIAPYRNPIITAKMLASLDVLSNGRVIVGLGVGWMKEEFDNLGTPAFAERGRVTDEYIRAFRELWTSDNPTFSGQFCNFSNIVFLPKPVQKPTIPIWIGGHSKQAIRRAARLGDGWHPIGGVPTIPLEPDDVRKDLATLAEFARAAGRDPKQIRVALKGSLFDKEKKIEGRRRRFMGDAEEIAADIRDYRAAGVDMMIFDVRRPSSAETLDRMEWMAKEVIVKV
ncbi:MAG: LLM class F420-dependent oxidoreductase [Deltaproteobacteria bacterium]|nr:LLM class F420-dependent oxidoreductase [Deltaproteobacteria bacterium]MDZ4346572.1 LLM class F420-dependent oxidoreductase [Candidatus Binatia bacterium]